MDHNQRLGDLHSAASAVNCALHMIAVTRAAAPGPGKDYIAKQLAVSPHWRVVESFIKYPAKMVQMLQLTRRLPR